MDYTALSFFLSLSLSLSLSLFLYLSLSLSVSLSLSLSLSLSPSLPLSLSLSLPFSFGVLEAKNRVQEVHVSSKFKHAVKCISRKGLFQVRPPKYEVTLSFGGVHLIFQIRELIKGLQRALKPTLESSTLEKKKLLRKISTHVNKTSPFTWILCFLFGNLSSLFQCCRTKQI